METPTSNQDSWSISNEREFMENLVSARFNFLLLLFSIVIAGAMGVKTQKLFVILLVVGTIICSLVSLTVYRAHIKLDVILKLLHNTSGHPVKIVGDEVKKMGKRGLFSVAWIIGILVPLLCSGSLIFATFCACVGWLTVE